VIETPDQLAGLRIGSFPAPSTTYTVIEKLKRTHPALAQTTIVQGGVGTQLAMLQAGKIDIAVDLEPAASVAEANGYRSVLNISKFTAPQAVTGLMVSKTYMNSHADQVQRVVNALQRAITAMYTDPEVALRTARKVFPDLSEKVLSRAVHHMLRDAMYPHSVVIPDEYWQRAIQLRIDSGDLKRPQATEVAVENRFAQSAAAQFGLK